MEGKVGPSPLSAGPAQCRSVLHSFSRVGGRFAVLDVQIPPCLVQLLVMLVQTLECHARIHVSYMCYILFLLRLAHPLVAPHWNWGRFYLHSMWCPSTSVQHCAPYTPDGRLQCSISRPRLPSSDTGRCCTPLRALLPLQCCAFTWQ